MISVSPSPRRKQYAWEDDRSGSQSPYPDRRAQGGRRKRGRKSSSRSRSVNYSPPPRRDGRRRPDSRRRGRRNRSDSRRRSRSRSRSRGGGGGKGKGKGNSVCVDFINDKCRRGERCTFSHDEEECRRLEEMFASKPCKMGARCTRPNCLFVHPGDPPRRSRFASPRSSESPDRPRRREVQIPMMKAVGWKLYGEMSVLEDLKVPKLVLDTKSKDILVRLHGTDMNPLNLRKCDGALSTELSIVLPGHGGDQGMACSSAGVIEELSDDARMSGKFTVGDTVWFANRWESTTAIEEYRLVDYRVTSLKPKALSFADAAAVPLLALTTWGAMIERMNMDIHLFGGGARLPRFTEGNKAVFLALPGGSAAGSFALQFAARYLSKYKNLTVVAAASRPESVEWCKKMGAEHVINHEAYSLKDELDKVGVKGLDYVFCGTAPTLHAEKLYALMNPYGQIASYHEGIFEKVDACVPNRIALHRERVGFGNLFEADGEVLATVARLFDDPSVGLQSLVTQKFSELTAETVRQAQTWHTLKSIDGEAVGKAVFEIK